MKRQVKRFLIGPERGILSGVNTSYLSGLRIATIGGLAAFVGGIMVAIGAEHFGKVVVIAGIVIGFLGIGIHFIFMMIMLNLKLKRKVD